MAGWALIRYSPAACSGVRLAGIIAVGKEVLTLEAGRTGGRCRCCGCGTCPQCVSGVSTSGPAIGINSARLYALGLLPAEYVAIDRADLNVARLPDELDFVTAASLGCRSVTIVLGYCGTRQGGSRSMGCGAWLRRRRLSAITIANAVGANVVAVDISDEKLAFCADCAVAAVKANENDTVVEQVREMTRGAHVSLDALARAFYLFSFHRKFTAIRTCSKR